MSNFLLKDQVIKIINNDQQINDQQINDQQINDQQINDQQINDQQNNDQQNNDQQINDQQINDQQNNDEQINDQQINDQQINDEQINDEQINDQQINDQQINDEQINDEQINDEQINDQQINDQQINDEQINDQQINDEQINDEQINDEQINISVNLSINNNMVEINDNNSKQYHKFETPKSGHVGNYYCVINWMKQYGNWDLVRIGTPMDGNCLFHSISNSFFVPYYTENINGTRISRIKIIQSMRQELSEKLEEKISAENNAPRNYDLLNGGNTSIFAKYVPEFDIKYMQSQLNSNYPIGYGYMEFIGNTLNKDIYIIESNRKDIYLTDELPLTIKGNRMSIVLYYINGHYELCGIRTENGYNTHFSPQHSLIKFLNNRVNNIINKK